MKRLITLSLAAMIAIVLSGCLSPSGDSLGKQRANAKLVTKTALGHLYKSIPSAKQKIQQAAGYAVFDDWGIQVFLPSTETGWGLVVNNKTGQETFMKMFSIGLGLGIGVRDFRGVFVFDTEEAMTRFITSGWGFGGQANAAFKFGDTGGAVAAAAEVAPGITLYKYTQNGVALQATLQGTKVWQNTTLSKK